MGPGVRGGVTPPTRARNLAAPSGGTLDMRIPPPTACSVHEGYRGGVPAGRATMSRWGWLLWCRCLWGVMMAGAVLIVGPEDTPPTPTGSPPRRHEKPSHQAPNLSHPHTKPRSHRAEHGHWIVKRPYPSSVTASMIVTQLLRSLTLTWPIRRVHS
jgi:hypothetical protein